MADDMRTLGYICPKCGAQVMGARSVFALEASDAEIECSCGGSVLRTNYDGQNYHILVPCGVCGQTHEAVCPPERMLHAATALSCPDSKQFCCFIGDEGTVEHHLREASIAISKEKAQENSGEAEAFTDNVIMYEFLSELKDIAARPNGITCGCGSHGCLERLVSVDRVRSILQQQAAHFPGSSLLQSDPEQITIPQVFAASSQEDPLARYLVDYLARAFAAALRNISLVFDPDLIVFQGDYAWADPYFDKRQRGILREIQYIPPERPYEIHYDKRPLSEMDLLGSYTALTRRYFATPALYQESDPG